MGQKSKRKTTPVLTIASTCALCIWEESMTEQDAFEISASVRGKNTMKWFSPFWVVVFSALVDLCFSSENKGKS